MNPALLSSKNMNWQTPESFLDLVRQLDVIGLDPATTKSNPTKAVHIYTPDEDGLSQPWTGKGLVYCNPPYGRSLPKWIKKASIEAAKGAEIIMLITARTDTKWFQEWVLSADAVCLWKGRIVFVDPDPNVPEEKRKNPATFPSAVVYWGPRPLSFRAIFTSKGYIITP